MEQTPQKKPNPAAADLGLGAPRAGRKQFWCFKPLGTITCASSRRKLIPTGSQACTKSVSGLRVHPGHQGARSNVGGVQARPQGRPCAQAVRGADVWADRVRDPRSLPPPASHSGCLCPRRFGVCLPRGLFQATLAAYAQQHDAAKAGTAPAGTLPRWACLQRCQSCCYRQAGPSPPPSPSYLDQGAGTGEQPEGAVQAERAHLKVVGAATQLLPSGHKDRLQEP